MGEVAAREHELGLHVLDQLSEGFDRLLLVVAAEVEVGDVEDAGLHDSESLSVRPHSGHENFRRGYYTRTMAEEGPTDAPEIFDDLYLGLRAGGALRKQRRGEPLTRDEQEALGRWQRLSVGRKTLAIGAFSVGTFGLGFTLGGLIFGRWRKA